MPEEDSTSNGEVVAIAANDTEANSDANATSINEKNSKPKSKSGAPLTEEFQLQVMDLVKGIDECQLDFIQDMCQKRQSEIWDEKKPKEPTMDDFDAAKEEE